MWSLDHKESWVPKNWCFGTVVLEKTLERPLDCKEIKPVSPGKSVLNIHWKDWCWSWSCSTLATWCEDLTHRKRPWSWERLKAGGEEDDRGWDGCMASMIPWTCLSKLQWWTGRPGVLWSMGSQVVGRDERLNWTGSFRSGLCSPLGLCMVMCFMVPTELLVSVAFSSSLCSSEWMLTVDLSEFADMSPFSSLLFNETF